MLPNKRVDILLKCSRNNIHRFGKENQETINPNFCTADQIANNKLGIRLKYKRLKANDLRNACDAIVDDISVDI